MTQLPDVTAFIQGLRSLAQNPESPAHNLFAPRVPILITRAPGRLDLMGGIADYSGSMVLELPIREAALVAIQRDPGKMIRIVSLGSESGDRSLSFEMRLADFYNPEGPISYEEARGYFARDSHCQWAAYAAGAFLVLARERKTQFAEGARILIDSSVPEGKGVSSSAAIEVAVMQAVAAAFHISIQPRDLAILCQKVENSVVGAPCGVMDQMASSCGEEGRLMALLCQPAELQGMVSLPPDAAIWGIDSGVRHSVSGADYGSVRVGAFMGYRILADLEGMPATMKSNGVVTIDDRLWGGYLANVGPARFEQFYAHSLPERISGAAFLARYGGTTDSVTRVDPDRSYAVRIPTAHPIYEHSRVGSFIKLMRGEIDELRLEELGELMYQSHASYSACGLGSEGTDRLVEMVREAGPRRGLFGAKITGGGSGGTVAVLGRPDAADVIEEITHRYARETDRAPYLFHGSSPGAAAFGTLQA